MRLYTFSSACLVLANVGSVFSLEGVLSIPPSSFWRDGADGSWSTFQVQVGTPDQTVRLLPGTSASAGNSIWVVLPEGCTVNNAGVDNCAQSRGGLFFRNESSTWSTQRLINGGLFMLSIYEESQLGLAGNALYAFETVQLGVGGQGLPILQNQVVAGIATDDFWLGSLGISPIAFNFTNLNDPIPSPMGTLRAQNAIGSMSWAYTAGARYKSPPVFGSLTLGGFDHSRMNSSANVTVPFGSDISRDLLIAVRSITYDSLGSSPLLADGIYAFIDSMVSAMYLPVSVCQAFEQAFNLTWDPTHELYLLTDQQHRSLIAQNPVISFTVGNTTDQGSEVATTVIEFPYSAFDLNITQPYVNHTTRYFPLKRAQNESQYTLGRVFLQEAYVIADYDRQQFTVSQAAFPQRQSDQSLEAILPPGDAQNTTTTPSKPSSQDHKSLSTGAITGIAVGSVMVLGLIGLGTWLCARSRTRRHHRDHERTPSPAYFSDKADSSKAELASTPIAELAWNKTDGHVEVADTTYYEMVGHKHARLELSGGGRTPKEGFTRYEMAGQESFVSELDSRGRREVYELPAESRLGYVGVRETSNDNLHRHSMDHSLPKIM